MVQIAEIGSGDKLDTAIVEMELMFQEWELEALASKKSLRMNKLYDDMIIVFNALSKKDPFFKYASEFVMLMKECLKARQEKPLLTQQGSIG